jgi:hypothetical protein
MDQYLKSLKEKAGTADRIYITETDRSRLKKNIESDIYYGKIPDKYIRDLNMKSAGR